MCQHACATDLNYVMMVYATPGGIIKRSVIISFTKYQLNTLSTFQRRLKERYMKVFYSSVRDEDFHIDSVGDYYITAYGYAQEDHALDLYMQLWKNLTMMYCAMEHHLLVDGCWMELQMVGTNTWGMLMKSGKQLVITKSSKVLIESLDFYCGILSSNISFINHFASIYTQR